MARLLDEAALNGTLLEGLPRELTLEEAYAVQRDSLSLRERRGERLVGWKMGLTSRAKMKQMNVHQPIYGYLTDAMLLPDGDVVPADKLQQPRVEPELCFLMGADLNAPVTPAQALTAVRSVCAALEVLDSRYKEFRFSLPNVVADNASAAYVILGSDAVAPVDLDCLGIVLECDGRVVETASSAAVYEHPARSLAALVNMLSPRSLRAGDIVMTGGATQAIGLAGCRHVRVSIERIGTASLHFDGERREIGGQGG